MMRTMDGSAYTEYQKISKESSNEDRQLNALNYLTNWYEGAVKKNPSMAVSYTHLDVYKRQAQECISNKISTRDSYVNSTDYSNFGIYTQNSVSCLLYTSYRMNMAIRSERQNGTGKDVKH